MIMTNTTDDLQRRANGPINKTLLAMSTGLSGVGCLTILITYGLYKDIRTASRHIIICLSIADLVTVLANCSGLAIQPSTENDTFCIIQSFIGSTAILCSFLWTIMLAVYLYVALVCESQRLAKRMIWPWFHILCWSVPLIINIVALLKKRLGNNTDAGTAGWCWIKITSKNDRRWHMIAWMFIDGKGIELLAYVIVLILYVAVKRHLWRKRNNSLPRTKSFMSQRTADAARHADKKLIIIPLLFILLRMWGTIRFFLYVAGKTNHGSAPVWEIVLLYLHSVGDNLQGATNCLLFCIFTPKVRNHIKRSIFACCQALRCCYVEHDFDESMDERTCLLDSQRQKSKKEKMNLNV